MNSEISWTETAHLYSGLSWLKFYFVYENRPHPTSALSPNFHVEIKRKFPLYAPTPRLWSTIHLPVFNHVTKLSYHYCQACLPVVFFLKKQRLAKKKVQALYSCKRVVLLVWWNILVKMVVMLEQLQKWYKRDLS